MNNFNVISPETTENLLKVMAENQGKKFRFGAGYTDLILEIKAAPDEELTVINLARLDDAQFTSIEKSDEGTTLGALVTAGTLVSDPDLRCQFPVLWRAAEELASRQIREVATVGGNLCTASPAGDLSAALVALQARCEILSAAGGVRVVPLSDFLLGVRKIDLGEDEVLRSIQVPAQPRHDRTYSDFVKVGTRRSMEIAVVSLAYHILVDAKDTVTHAGIAIGSVAPTIRFVTSACEFLIGKKFSAIGSSESETFAAKVLEYAEPISDMRASAWYRKEVLYNICRGSFE